MHLSSHPRPSIPPPACRHPHALFSAPAGLPRGKPKNPLRSSSICYNPHHPRACRPAPPSIRPLPAHPWAPHVRRAGPNTNPWAGPPERPRAPTTPAGPLRARRRPATPPPASPAPCSRAPAPLETSPRPKHLLPTRRQGRAPPDTASRPAHCPHPALTPSPGAGPGTQGPDPSSLPVFLLPRGKSPSPPPPPHFCHPRPSIPPPTCTCWPAATAPYHLHQPPLAPL